MSLLFSLSNREGWKVGQERQQKVPNFFHRCYSKVTWQLNTVQFRLAWLCQNRFSWKTHVWPKWPILFSFLCPKSSHWKYYTFEYESDWRDWTWPNLFFLPVLGLVTSDSKLVSPALKKRQPLESMIIALAGPFPCSTSLWCPHKGFKTLGAIYSSSANTFPVSWW